MTEKVQTVIITLALATAMVDILLVVVAGVYWITGGRL